MAKIVTVLGIDGEFLRGVRLEEKGGGFVCAEVESWPLAADEPEASDAAAAEILDAPADDAPVESVVEEDKPLARAFKAAAKYFGQTEFTLALPLSKLLMKGVRLPAETREDLMGAAALELDGISPFPDEELAPAAEVVAETDSEIQVLVSALPSASAAEVGAALDAAGVHVTRTDATALGWLRTLWPRLCEVEARRRLVLLNLGDGWDLAVLDDGAPVQLRGIGAVDSIAELGREVTLSLLACDTGGVDVGDVVVCCMQEPEKDVLDRLSAFGPVRTVLVDDPSAGVEGCARREAEGGTFDVTPADWTESLTESRFRRKFKAFLCVAVGLWMAVMGVLFGYEVVYDQLRDRQKDLCKKHARAFKEVEALTNRVALLDRYQDRSKCALEMLKLVSDHMPDGEDMKLEEFIFKRGEGVEVRGKAPDRDSEWKYEDALRNIQDPAWDEDNSGEPPPLFPSVEAKGRSVQNKEGLFPFRLEAKFQAPNNDNGSTGGRAR